MLDRLRILTRLQVEFRQHCASRPKRRSQCDAFLGGLHGELKFWRTRLCPFLGQHVRVKVEENGIVWLSCQLRLHGRERALEIVRIRRGQSLGRHAERLGGVQFVCFFKIGLRVVILPELDVKDAPRKIERRGFRLLPYSVVHYVDTNLERLMDSGDGGKIQVGMDIRGFKQNCLSECADGALRVPSVFICSGGEFQRFRVRPVFKQRTERRDCVLWVVSHQLDRCQQLALPVILGIQGQSTLENLRGLIKFL